MPTRKPQLLYSSFPDPLNQALYRSDTTAMKAFVHGALVRGNSPQDTVAQLAVGENAVYGRRCSMMRRTRSLSGWRLVALVSTRCEPAWFEGPDSTADSHQSGLNCESAPPNQAAAAIS
jgi:hypothetical protein